MSCPGRGAAEEEIAPRTDVEAIRLRPGMFIGNTDARGLHDMLFGLVRSALAEFARGGHSLRVTLRADGFAEVADDGPLLREYSSPDVPPLEFIFTRFHGHNPNPGGRDWLSYATANALSAELSVTARSPGSRYHHSFRRGVTHAVLQSGGPPDDRGLTVRFRPDPDIFGTVQFDSATIRDRLRQCAFLHSGVRITFRDEASGARDEFEYADGIREYVRHLNADRTPLHADVIVTRGEEDGMRYEVGLQWCAGEDELPMSFANAEFNRDGGTQMTGMRTAVTRVLNDFIREQLDSERDVKGEDSRCGLTAVVAVRLAQPHYEGATRTRLSNPEVGRAVASGVGEFLREYFAAKREVAEVIIRNAILERNLREAASAARKQVRGKRAG